MAHSTILSTDGGADGSYHHPFHRWWCRWLTAPSLPQMVVQMAHSTTCTICSPKDTGDPPKTFTFDGAYGTDSTTEAIYNDVAFPIVEVSAL